MADLRVHAAGNSRARATDEGGVAVIRFGRRGHES